MAQAQDEIGNWSQAMSHDAMAAGVVGDDDFTKFLDLENGFEFPQHMQTDEGHTALDTPMGRLAFGAQNAMADDSSDIMQNIDVTTRATNNAQMQSPYGGIQIDEQHQQFQQQYQMFQQMQQNQHYRIPPTPVSGEMHVAKYPGLVENAGQLIFDRNQASFPLLVSPAQTPLDNTWAVPDYVGVEDFFSPLTSPAIEAQPPFSTNATSSPIDLNDSSAHQTASAPPAKRSRRKANQAPVRPARSVGQSPAMKPQKRRQQTMKSLSMDKIEAELAQGKDVRLQPGSARTGTVPSSEDSVSPEPLSEILMRPPPVPSTTAKSPAQALRPKTSAEGMPATPAMLMKMPAKQSSTDKDLHSNHTGGGEIMEDIALPDAAAAASGVLPILKSNSNSHVSTITYDGESTPTLAAKTPKLSIDSTPRMSSMQTASNSTESLDKMKRPETRAGGKTSKKRPSISQSAISPALRPKISPSISPLVPSNSNHNFSAETSALYLASKSNYQNILDGTHLPGVSYPETLAENLSSKRTSHKIAEQGRRNRINLALKEIESLLPSSITAPMKKEKPTTKQEPTDEGSPGTKAAANGGGANQGASKASTVEMAIIYIKSLQAELKETKDRLEAAEKTLAEGGSNSGQEASE